MMKIKINWNLIEWLYEVTNLDMFSYDYESGWIASVKELEDKDGFVKVNSEGVSGYFTEKNYLIARCWVMEMKIDENCDTST